MDQYFNAMGIPVSETQLNQFEIFYKLLIQENEKYNLTGITDKEEVYIKHFLDSLLIQQLPFDFNAKTMIDIGTGAGFPAIPLKILYPSLKMTCLDALNKRIGFINMSIEALHLNDVELIHGRAEDFGQNPKYRGQFDFAVSRAVAELRLLLEFVMPFVKTNGYFLAYKSLKSELELTEAKKALSELKSEVIDIKRFELPNGNGHRDIIIVKKIGEIAKKYPRKPGIPKKSPL